MAMVAAMMVVVAPPLVSGHGAMTFPKPRNAYDGTLYPWVDWAFPCDPTHQGDNCTVVKETIKENLKDVAFARFGTPCPTHASTARARYHVALV